ncbi:MAG: hypothetical protein JWO81_2661 [Alphaproteobacteria bacterium]|nr:hypothetical protein [Alphaproteobacteria bacterium]
MRPLTRGERALAASIFGAAIEYDAVTIRRQKWWPLQPRNVIMAPTGHVYIHPRSGLWSEDFARESVPLQALLIHELTHVWQSQRCGKWYLVLMRHPLCRYRYTYEPGRSFTRYGLEQQAEIVRHTFLLEHGYRVVGSATLEQLRSILPF